MENKQLKHPEHWFFIQFSQFSRSVVSDSFWHHESQHSRPPCPSPTPRVHPDSCPSSQLMPSSHLILCRPLLLLPPIRPSIRVFSNESTLCMRWPKYVRQWGTTARLLEWPQCWKRHYSSLHERLLGITGGKAEWYSHFGGQFNSFLKS